jgi:hypothetical protein
MIYSRRKFIRDTLNAAGALAFYPLTSCRADSARPGGFKNFEPAYLKLEREGKLAEREKELWDIYKECRLCPRGCEALGRAALR